MKEIFLIILGWALGIISTFLYDNYKEARRKNAIATALITEIEEYIKNMERELKYMQDEESFPSSSSPLVKIFYSRDFYESYKEEICLFSPETVMKVTRFYNFVKIIDNDKEPLTRLSPL